jgi:hypothetical protein
MTYDLTGAPKRTDEVIYSEDVIHWLSEMETVYGPRPGEGIDTVHVEDMSVEEQDLYGFLCELRQEAGHVSDWAYNVSIVRDSFFAEYAENEVEECGLLPSALPEIVARNINWQGVAEDMQEDYLQFEAGGVTWWVRF